MNKTIINHHERWLGTTQNAQITCNSISELQDTKMHLWQSTSARRLLEHTDAEIEIKINQTVLHRPPLKAGAYFKGGQGVLQTVCKHFAYFYLKNLERLQTDT